MRVLLHNPEPPADSGKARHPSIVILIVILINSYLALSERTQLCTVEEHSSI